MPTGFIGRGLVLRLQRRGHAVVAWVRSPHRARAQLGEDVPLPSLETADQELADVLSQFETVINLAGEPLFGKRRTPGRTRAIVESGVALTSRLVGGMRRAERPPKILISDSAGDYDGHQAAERLKEQDAPPTGFLAQLCCDWEHAAMATATAGARGDWVRQPVAHGRELLPEEAATLHFDGGAQRPERSH